MARTKFLDRIEKLIHVNMLSEASNYDVRRMAEHCVMSAENYGLVTERAIAAFVLHMVRINPEFHLQPRVRTLLLDKSVDDLARMKRLLTDTAESDWVEAAAMCNPMLNWRSYLQPA
jgi:hypothetical protein